jgi:hypothetical protein
VYISKDFERVGRVVDSWKRFQRKRRHSAKLDISSELEKFVAIPE